MLGWQVHHITSAHCLTDIQRPRQHRGCQACVHTFAFNQRVKLRSVQQCTASFVNPMMEIVPNVCSRGVASHCTTSALQGEQQTAAAAKVSQDMHDLHDQITEFWQVRRSTMSS